MTPEPTAPRHSLIENAQGLTAGMVLTSLGVTFIGQAGLLTGQTAGIAFIIAYATGWGFGPVFFVVNLPFYYFAVRQMGWGFTLRTLGCVAGVSVLTAIAPGLVPLGAVPPLSAAILGGCVAGVGLLALFRHGASLGGVGIMAIYLQDRHGIRAGWVQMAVDLCVLVLAFAVVPPLSVLMSIAGAAVMNMILAFNHRRDRYVAI
ncbi:YitT family protein (plasmid) [Paroceanicella profunda]|uniref:YitT family protein n=1 Tax=Paroceanicella profunda TaxID=2579971 RepID=A0A5B8FIL3_9RHOB|nr:YitT family protein [Paroceanicella profunda]QDL93931.1 YitT family protein [Paroceanicella profunda]